MGKSNLAPSISRGHNIPVGAMLILAFLSLNNYILINLTSRHSRDSTQEVRPLSRQQQHQQQQHQQQHQQHHQQHLQQQQQQQLQQQQQQYEGTLKKTLISVKQVNPRQKLYH